MALSDTDLNSITEINLTELIEGGVAEGIAIDYKQQHYGKKDDDIKEFLKDVSSFANTSGGHLVIGITESNSIPTVCNGVEIESLEAEKSRYENYCRDCIQPRIVGLKIHSINLASGKAVVVLRIPRSQNPPHRITYKNSNRFYARNSTGAYELSVEELRAVFSGSQLIVDRVRAFRRDQINKLLVGDTPVDLAEDSGSLVLHLIPYSAFGARKIIDLVHAQDLSRDFRPVGSSSGYSPRINIDGFINIRGGANCYGYTQVFRDGSIEAVKVRICFDRNGTKMLGSVDFESALVGSVPQYLNGLEKLGIDCPIIIAVTLLGVKGAVLGISANDNAFDPPDAIRKDTLFLPEVIIDQYASDETYVRELKSIIDVLWNAAGRIESRHFDTNGAWKNPGYR